MRVSFLEIYNEVITDLLEPQAGPLKVHEDPHKGVFVGGAREEIVTSVEEVLALVLRGNSQRHVGETNMNEHSSRSHSIFRMVVESRRRSSEGAVDDAVKVAMLSLVDLAGSERVKDTSTAHVISGNHSFVTLFSEAEGQRLVEGGHINKSLLVLGTVINKLAEGSSHIPYRDSKLTRILQPAIGGNSRTVPPPTNL